MDVAYEMWIMQLNFTASSAYGQCENISRKMVETFPELELVRGHYICKYWGNREHWWLINAAGDIVDPTAIQFPSFGLGEYIKLDEDKKEPTGKCLNCGQYCYDGNMCCSNVCAKENLRYLNG